MTARKTTTPSLAILDALDSLASDVRRNHPEVPTNIVFALASGRSRGGAIHGHFAPESWKTGHEILFGGESLERGAVPTFGTLVHELAHAVAHETGVRDTSNGNRYHNKKFKEIAEKLGIEVAQAPTIGWSVTSVPESTSKKYAKGLKKLDTALVTYRKGYSEAGSAPKPPRAKPNSTKMKIWCECPDNAVTVSIRWFAENQETLYCENCDTHFTHI